MRRLLLVPLTALAFLLVACLPVGPSGNSGSPFENAVAARANDARAASGVGTIGWADWLANDAQHTVNVCAANNWGEYTLHTCHDITGVPENLVVLPGCDYSDGRARWAIDLWLNSYGHRIFLLDQAGWPPKSAQGVGEVCDTSTGDGYPRQYIAWAAQ